jgi:hypothetical protein
LYTLGLCAKSLGVVPPFVIVSVHWPGSRAGESRVL